MNLEDRSKTVTIVSKYTSGKTDKILYSVNSFVRNFDAFQYNNLPWQTLAGKLDPIHAWRHIQVYGPVAIQLCL